jgi:hypothetical protein
LGLDVQATGRRGGNGLLLRARGLGVWGRSWAFRRAYYDVLPLYAGTTVLGGFDLSRPDRDRLPPLLNLDVGLAYSWTLRGGQTVELAFDIVNVLDRRNVLDWSLRPGEDGSLTPYTRTLPGAQPSLRLRVSV